MASPKSPQEMFQAMMANIKAKTGKEFNAWVQLAKRSGQSKFKALTDHMKKEHGLTHGYAQMVAWGVLDPARLAVGNKDETMVDALYTGKKAALRPIYDALMKTKVKLGPDVDLVICKTYTSFRTKSQFAILAPRTNTAVDLELALPAETPSRERLEPIKNSNPKFTHRIRISDPQQVDKTVVELLECARDASAL